MNNSLVSIIIPCYNASEFILETIQSILVQKGVNLEVIVVNDGSTDDSEKQIRSIKDERIHYFYQSNNGVSSARNIGLQKSKGDFVIFFDADDIMSDDFVVSRLAHIAHYDFICGEVRKFSGAGLDSSRDYRGAGSEAVSEILYFDQNVVTCPSNYLFNASFLRENRMEFNTTLSSSADKYFIMECALIGKGICDKNCSHLLYRVNINGMSYALTQKLVRDNETFYNLIKKKTLLPPNIKEKGLFLGYYMLSGANIKVKNRLNSIKYGFKAFFIDPLVFMKKLFD